MGGRGGGREGGWVGGRGGGREGGWVGGREGGREGGRGLEREKSALISDICCNHAMSNRDPSLFCTSLK